MNRLYHSIAFGAALWVAGHAGASETCTIAYRVEGTLVVSDTHLGKGDTAQPLQGSLVVAYPQGDDGRVTDGKVKILHYAMSQRFRLDAVAKVTTAIHHYAPSCNGETAPTWRLPSDEGFPKSCDYDGRGRAVAAGELRRDAGRIELARCKAASTYWSKDRRAYKISDKSKGRGCLDQLHAVGNVHCQGRFACRLGDLKAGDNPQYQEWTQPLINGPPESESYVTVSADLRAIESPTGAPGGHQSYNLPNDSPSRTWFSFTAKRADDSRFTTCP